MTDITICFFGITRSLRYTIRSIDQHVFEASARLAKTRRYAHLYEQDRAISINGREEGILVKGEHAMLQLDRLELERPGGCLDVWDFEGIKRFGDTWNNDFISLRNLMHQLNSLHRVSAMALEDGAEICVFCRPDLKYHDSLGQVIEEALSGTDARIWLPEWQSWGGRNDRFAVVRGRAAIVAYGQRLEEARHFCDVNGALHSEQLVHFALDQAGIPVTEITNRASRVRASGVMVKESFKTGDGAIRDVQRKKQLWRLLDRSGFKPVAKAVFRLVETFRRGVVDFRNRRKY